MNRRVPNGTHGGVRGRKFLIKRNFLLLDCSTDKGVFLMRELGVSEKRLPALIELYEYFMDYGYQTIDMPVKNREGNYVTKGFDGSIYMLRRMPPGRECDVRRAAELF